MTVDEFSARIEMNENRLMHQEVAFEEVTYSLLAQEKRLREQPHMIIRLGAHVRSLLPTEIARANEETSPPHY